MESPNLTAIVNAHREGLLAQATLLSLTQAVSHAEREGLQVETIAVLDCPDAVTTEMFESYARSHNGTSVLKVDHGELGRSRNSGVAAARGEWIAFLDADDLWGANWLSGAYHMAKSDPRPVVWHPEVSVYFGNNCHIFVHVDAEDPSFNPRGLAITNYWTALCFARRSLLLDTPYRPTNIRNQLGFEDWGWNSEVAAQGVLHKIVPNTGHAIRVKEDSLLKQTNSANCMPYPSELFRNMLRNRVLPDPLPASSALRAVDRKPLIKAAG